MAAKPEDYRVSELLSKGSKAIDKTRDKKSGSIIVQKKDGKQVPIGLSKEDAEKYADRIKKGKPVTHIQKQKPFVKYGVKPIRDIKPGDTAKYKSDWIDTDEFDVIKENQTKFSGETAGYLEKPKYNEEELQKALDVRVDELIKKQKPTKGPFILLNKYTKLQDRFDLKVGELELLRDLLNKEISANESLRTDVATLEVSMDSAQLQRAAAENQTQAANERYAKLLDNFQQALIKGTKEGIERVSLTAQVRGLQAQKVTLNSLLQVQKDIVTSLQQIEAAEEAAQETTAILSSLSGPPNSYEQKGDYAWKIPENNVKNQGQLDNGDIFHFTSQRHSHGWDNGNDLELYNFNEEKDVQYTISVSVKNGGHSSVWLGFSSTSGTIPKRSGETPGKKMITASKVKNISSPKGRGKTFTDEWTLTIDGTSFVKQGKFWRKLRSGGSGN
jgi:hypothetical protein